MRTCNIEDYSYITNTLIIFILMVLFVMLASVGYFHAQRPPVYDKSQVEITAKEYDILIEYSAKYPSLNREIGDAIANDGIITNQEFSEVLGVYQTVIMTRERKKAVERLSKQIGESNGF